MQSRKNFIPVPDGNVAKYFSYREAWGRIKQSIACGYYLEAVTLEESIISDRLISYLVRVGAAKSDSKLQTQPLARLIKEWKNHVPEAICDSFCHDLQSEIDEWRVRRNEVVHSMVKSIPGTEHHDVLNFKKEAELVALKGERLAKSLCNWYKKIKQQMSRQEMV